MAADKRSYASGFFELKIDTHKTSAYLKSVDGGYARASVVDEPMGTHNMRVKHTSTVEIEPFSIEFGISAADSVLKWIQASWRKDWCRHNGQITHADFNCAQTFTHEFYDALIAETTFPTLDGSSKDAAYIKIKVQPERIVTKQEDGEKLQPLMGQKQKMWTCSGFRLNIDGIDDMKYTNKIESFTIKQGIKKHYSGAERFPQIEPTKIEFPNIVGTISAQYGGKLHDWYKQAVVTGQHDAKAQKSGSLEFLSPNREKVLFRINLYEMGIVHCSMLPSTANSDQIKRMKFEVYVGRMDIDGSGPLGLE